MTIKKLIKHDRYVEDLKLRLRSEYDLLVENVPLYSKRNRLVAEIDLIAYKGDCCDIFEVKCSYRITKARRQLEKIRRIISTESKVRNSFFFCGESGSLVEIGKENRQIVPECIIR